MAHRERRTSLAALSVPTFVFCVSKTHDVALESLESPAHTNGSTTPNVDLSSTGLRTGPLEGRHQRAHRRVKGALTFLHQPELLHESDSPDWLQLVGLRAPAAH
jgi:hypothetical protein